MGHRRTSWAALILLAGCLSEDRAGEKWEEWLADHDSCATSEDCALVYPGCPLGCGDAVNAANVDEAERKARRLINRYELPGRRCDYECMSLTGARCEAGRCTVLVGDY